MPEGEHGMKNIRNQLDVRMISRINKSIMPSVKVQLWNRAGFDWDIDFGWQPGWQVGSHAGNQALVILDQIRKLM